MTEPTITPTDYTTTPAPVPVTISWWQRFLVQAVTLVVTVAVFAAVAKGIRLAAPMFDRDPLSLGNFPFYAGGVVGVIAGGAARFALAGWFERRALRRR